ncbi:hypothetical protein Golob_009675 [Gossypium lobatum]|uniref:non-specific serine/threonine protein kinase n=1 Tax=Gossypium lobatum TaxID=34289 RepID=A0A7J8MJK0_9ROSI|nr:hypothetical protein [Gossypium lobatum]
MRFIVYELMPNGSLETQLHGPSRGSSLTWDMRMKIALDTARGLEHLHEHCNPPVIHRDLKSSNILLDSAFNAKLSDFGLAVTDAAQNKNNLKLSGTLGYVAPEYLLDGKLTDKSDVYAFGVVLLELLFGRKPVEKLARAQCQSIVTWAMPQLTDRSKLPSIVDPVIRDTMDLKHLYQVAAVAVLCVQPEPSYRPLITDVLHSLIPLVPMELGGTLRIHRKKKKNNSEKLLTQADDQSLEDAEKGVALSPSSFFAKCNSLSTLSLKGFASFIDYKMIEKATKNFDKINILDESGFKLVYKAILDNGTEVAVKKVFCLTKGIQREFENEVKLLSRFHHSNVISSYGYSIENETGFVVYELMHNGSLETQLHGPSRGSQLSWHRRLKIALDIARGLQYLNELCIPPIIHRNLKPSTILLDSNFNAKISDFGMAAVVAGGGGKEGGLSRSLNFLGKTGPIAPESILNGILTDMSDVYAFGVILLELVLGRKALEMSEVSGQECLARGVLTDRHVMPNFVDPVIRGTMSVNHLNQVGVIAYLCLEDEPKYRPLITDILNSLVPLVPVGLGGTLIV